MIRIISKFAVIIGFVNDRKWIAANEIFVNYVQIIYECVNFFTLCLGFIDLGLQRLVQGRAGLRNLLVFNTNFCRGISRTHKVDSLFTSRSMKFVASNIFMVKEYRVRVFML
jgi:hypothetical protein